MQAQSYTLQADSHTNRFSTIFPIFLSGSQIQQDEWKETLDRASDIYSDFMGKIKKRRIFFFISVLIYTIVWVTLTTVISLVGVFAMVGFLQLVVANSNAFVFFIVGFTAIMIALPMCSFFGIFLLSFLFLVPIKKIYNKGREELKNYLEQRNNEIFVPKGIQLMVQPREYLIFSNRNITRLTFLDIQVIWLNMPQAGNVFVVQPPSNQQYQVGPTNPFVQAPTPEAPPAKMPSQSNQYVQYKNDDEQF